MKQHNHEKRKRERKHITESQPFTKVKTKEPPVRSCKQRRAQPQSREEPRHINREIHEGRGKWDTLNKRKPRHQALQALSEEHIGTEQLRNRQGIVGGVHRKAGKRSRQGWDLSSNVAGISRAFHPCIESTGLMRSVLG